MKVRRGCLDYLASKADLDSPEKWGWTLSDVELSTAAVQAHLTECF